MMSDAYLRGNPQMVRMFGGEEGMKHFKAAVEKCTACGECVERCPYHLAIPELMPGKVAYFEDVMAKLNNT
jgi:predicted aldo/keto reductase-like oxidoreductase